VPVRRQRRFRYRCDCSTHQLSARRHNKIRHGRANYLCRSCGSEVVFVDSSRADSRSEAQ
jgi:SprT protein